MASAATKTAPQSPKPPTRSRSKPPNTPITKPVPAVPPFRSRRTLAEHVVTNMSIAGKGSYMQRVCMVASNRVPTEDGTAAIHALIESAALVANGSAPCQDWIRGLVAHYAAYTVLLVAGHEGVIGRFLQTLAADEADHFTAARIVLCFTNVNQFLLEECRMYYRYGDPPVQIMKQVSRDPATLQQQTRRFLKKWLRACTLMAQDIEAEKMHRRTNAGESFEASLDYLKALPETSLVDYVLRNEMLLALGEFVANFERIPHFDYYNELVWPIPYDFTPKNVYDWDIYDVNMIFGKQKVSD